MGNKISKKQIFLLIFLIIILLVAVGLNIYFVCFKTTKSITSNNEVSNTIKNTNTVDNIIENSINNNVNNSTLNETIDLSDKNPVVVDFTDDVDLEEVRQLMEDYGLAIQRVNLDSENLENNTILLLIAKRYFDSNSNKSSLEVDTKYAATADNVHKFLTELTGLDYSNTKRIQSYSNYVNYATNSNSYIYGKDYNVFSKEKYKCSDISITNEENGTYTANAIITRTIDKEVTNYNVTFDFKVNKDYTYEKYCIKSLKARNTSFDPDNTMHFAGNSLEEDENN